MMQNGSTVINNEINLVAESKNNVDSFSQKKKFEQKK